MSRRALLLALVLLLLLAGRAWYAGQIELAEEEAYYWTWSERLAWGYLDHPPLIAPLIRAGTALLGDTERGVRLLCLLLGTGVLGLSLGLLRAPDEANGAVAGQQESLLLLALSTMPLLALGGMLATPMVPLLLFWVLGLLGAARERWVLVGIAAGLAMLSMHTGMLLLPLLVLARPGDLRRRGPWLAAGVALLLTLPHLGWNLRHDLASYRLQASRLADGGPSLEPLVAQGGLAGPLLFIGLVAFWLRGWKGDRVERLCFWTSLPLLLLVGLTGAEASEAAPALLSATIGLGRLSRDVPRLRRLLSAGAGLNTALSALVLVHVLHPLVNLPIDPRDRLAGGRILGQSVAAWGIPTVYTARHEDAALIRFYGGLPAHALPGVGRPDQFELWPLELQDRALFVRTWQADAPPITDALGYEHGGPNLVRAYVSTPDPLQDRPVARWQVYEIWRAQP